ncbi:hypothetical protein [Kistimonas asteriae]|uniref:hypothetical protein n=1 Tax=Kistimonas asteriae TaxID=517724 RepID=UPI001BA50AD9|nr:hypothetical protein [Kistimonas asteriae]
MKHKLVLVTLNDKQIELAKAANGVKKIITHALICGPHGQLFGTEKFCRRYYTAWINVFPHLFDSAVETDTHEIIEYESTFDLVTKLIDIHDPLEKAANPLLQEFEKSKDRKNKGFFSRLFGS